MSLINKQAQTQYPGPVGLKIPLGIESINIPDPRTMHFAQALLRLSYTVYVRKAFVQTFRIRTCINQGGY
jgi:hypothetical protein